MPWLLDPGGTRRCSRSSLGNRRSLCRPPLVDGRLCSPSSWFWGEDAFDPVDRSALRECIEDEDPDLVALTPPRGVVKSSKPGRRRRIAGIAEDAASASLGLDS